MKGGLNTDKTRQYFLQLLSDFVNQNPPASCSDINWNEMLRLSKIHSVSGILGSLVNQYPIATDGKIAERLKSHFRKTFYTQTIRNQRMENLIKELSANNIDHILFKGYLIKDHYPIPELRTYGDIDFIIRESDREKCHKLMLGLGYSCDVSWGQVYSYKKTNEWYEVHTSIMTVNITPHADYIHYFEDIWSNAVLMENNTYRLTNEFHFIYLIVHIAKHIYSSGAGVRMYMDIALLIRHYGEDLNWAYILEELNSIHLDQFSNIVFLTCEKWFGITPPVNVDRISADTFELFEQYTMDGGVFGFIGDNTLGVAKMRKTLREDAKATRFTTFLKQAFPAARTIEPRYTYLKKHRYLLPVAWIDRWIRNYKRTSKLVSRIKETDVNAAKNQSDFLNHIGL